MTRLPPYLRRHGDRLRVDRSASVWVAIGADAWRWGRDRERSHIATLVPPGEDPTAFDWRLCAGHDPVLLHRAGKAEGTQVRTLVEALIRDGVDRVLDDQSGVLYAAQEVKNAA